MAKRSWRDPLGIERRVAEGVEAALPERIEALRSDATFMHELAVAMEAGASAHQTEMAWRRRQDFYDIAGAQTGFAIDSRTRETNVKRSQRHALYDPLYIRAIDLTADFIFGSGLPTPQPAGDKDNPAVQSLINLVWHDPLNLRWFSGGVAQRERCKQLLIDGEVPWYVYVPSPGERGYRYRPGSSLRITQVIEHSEYIGMPLLYRDTWGMGESRWYWSTEAVATLKSAAEARALVPTSDVSDRDWASSDLDAAFDTGPWMLLWKVSHDPMAMRGHPVFFSALDWGEANVGLAGNLTTYIKHVTAITGVIRGKMTATDIADKKAAIKSTLSGTVQPPGTGTYLLAGQGTEMHMMNVPTGGAEVFKTGFELTRLMMAAATGIPVHWLGDPSTGNLATAEAMQLPQLRLFEAWQRWFIGNYDEMFRVAWRHQHGRDDENTAELIDLDFPPLEVENTSQRLLSVAQAVTAGIISVEDGARQAASMLHVDNIDQFVENVKNEGRAGLDEAARLFEHEPYKVLAMFSKAAEQVKS